MDTIKKYHYQWNFLKTNCEPFKERIQKATVPEQNVSLMIIEYRTENFFINMAERPGTTSRIIYEKGF